jgi:hypothetical protein
MIRHARARAGIEVEPRREVSYWCVNGHHTARGWSAAATAPELWVCRHCGLPAGQDHAHPPEPMTNQPGKSPLARLLERRSEAECEALLAEALQSLRALRRGRGRRGHTRGHAGTAIMTTRPGIPARP